MTCHAQSAVDQEIDPDEITYPNDPARGKSAHTELALPVTVLTAIALAFATTWVAIVLVARFAHHSGGKALLQDTMTRFTGLIVLAMGVQFALTRYQAFMK